MQTLTFLFAFIAVLALIGVAAWVVRRYANNRLGANTQRGRMPRLAVIAGFEHADEPPQLARIALHRHGPGRHRRAGGGFAVDGAGVAESVRRAGSGQVR